MLHDDFVNPIKETPLEKCKLGNAVIDIPQELCEQKSLFKQVINVETWEKVLSNDQRAHLMKFLPTFPENDALNKQQAIRDLLTGTNIRFGNPLDHFHKKLKDGLFSPDMAKMATVLSRAKYHEYIYQQQRYFYKLLQEILVSRKRLLEAAAQLPPDQPVRMERIQPKPISNSIEQRTKRKYLRELQEMREEVGELATSSEDDNYPDAVPQKLTKRQKRQMMQLEASLNSDASCVMSTLAPKSYSAAGSSNGSFVRSLSPFEVTEENYRDMLTSHKCRRLGNEVHPELDVNGITLNDIGLRTNIPKRSAVKPASSGDSLPRKKVSKERKKQSGVSAAVSITAAASTSQTNTYTQSQTDVECRNTLPNDFQLLQPKLEPMSPEPEFSESIHDVSNFNSTPQLESGTSTEQELDFPTMKASLPSLSQGMHASFFSLLRDLMCESHDSKITTAKLEEKVQSWQESPFSGLNDWCCLTMNWSELTHSALKFLAGQSIIIPPENFIPYIDHKEKHQYWRWAGEGRDSDEVLASLASYWFDMRQEEDTTDSLDNTPVSPPPPRVLTDWAVRPTLDEEKALYREQERFRYENPHKAFTFIMHDYEAVVGPVKGVYGKDAGMNKAREHSLLISIRPPFVTILSLVRDAAARLPNGEGTRADICELLKDSQFLSPATDAQIHTVVSGALDRLHYERDPCVKYDVNRKMWIYLHRNRTEEEYERIHHAQATAPKTKKVVQKSKVKQVKNKASSRPASSLSTASTDSLLSIDLGTISTVSSSNNVPPTPVISTPSQSRAGANSPRIVGNQLSPKTPTSTQVISAAPPVVSLPSNTKRSTPSPSFYQTVTNAAADKSVAPVATVSSVGSTLNSSNVPMLGRSNSVPVSLAATIKIEPQDIVHKVSANDSMIASPFIIPSSQHNVCQASVSNSKPVLSSRNPHVVNITQVQLVGAGLQAAAIPITVSASSVKYSGSTAVAQLAPQAHPPKTVGAIMAQQAAAAAARAVTVNTQAIGTLKLLPSGITQTSTTFTGKPIAASMIAHPVTQAALQGVPTIVIKQEGSHQVASSLTTKAVMTSSKPVVARIISPPQVVSVGNLIASTLAASQKQGNPIQGGTTHTIKIQGSNIMRPKGGKPSHLNMLQASATTTSAGGQGALPRLAIVSQGNTTNLIPVCAGTSQQKLIATHSGQIGIVTSQLTTQQGHLSNVSKPTILTTPSGIKIMSATAGPSVTLAQLAGKAGQNVVVTSRPQTPTSVTVTMGTTAVGQQNLILTGGMQSASPTVMIASQRTLKPAHSVVMGGGGAPTVVMATQSSLRPIAATAVTSVNVKTLQGVKVIPVTQTNVGAKGKTQPVFARIITPPTNLTLRPASGIANAAQQGIGVIHAMAHVPSAGMNPVTTATLNNIRNPAPANLAQATIIRIQNPHAPVNSTILYPDRISKEPQ